MTDDDNRAIDSEERRSFMKKGALATGALALGGAGTAAAQENETDAGDEIDAGEAGGKALITIDNYHAVGRFAFVSGVVDWVPDLQGVRDNVWSNYQTRMIRWSGTNEIVPLWVARDASVGPFDEDMGFVTDLDDDSNQPQLWEMNREFTLFGDNPSLITVRFSPVGEEVEDGILANETWWQDEDEVGLGDTETPVGNQTQNETNDTA